MATYNPSESALTTIEVPADTEVADADSVNVALKEIADSLLWTNNRILGGLIDGKWRIPLNVLINTTSRFTFQTLSAGGGPCWLQSSVSDAGRLTIPVPLPVVKATITVVRAHVHGNADAGAAHAGLPGTMPRLSLIEVDYTSITAVPFLSWTDDTSASVPAYELDHTIEHSLSLNIDNTLNKDYYVLFEGEAGANKLVNHLALSGLELEMDPA